MQYYGTNSARSTEDDNKNTTVHKNNHNRTAKCWQQW